MWFCVNVCVFERTRVHVVSLDSELHAGEQHQIRNTIIMKGVLTSVDKPQEEERRSEDTERVQTGRNRNPDGFWEAGECLLSWNNDHIHTSLFNSLGFSLANYRNVIKFQTLQ